MTLEEVKEVFPEVSKEAPQGTFGYIYVTFEPISGKFYIGKKTRQRWKESYYGSGHYPTKWKKEGLVLKHWPIQWCFSKNELNNAEHIWVDKFKNCTDITNMVEGGGGITGSGGAKAISKEYTQRLSDAFSGENNPFYGKCHTEETKQKISQHHKKYYETHDNYYLGKHLTEETKEKLRQKANSRWANIEMREKYIKGFLDYYKTHNAPFLGQEHTEETKEMMSQRKVELFKKDRVEYTPNTAKLVGCVKARVKVQCIETGEVFNSITDANRAYGVKSSAISAVCKGKRKTTLGYHWRYYDEEVTNEQYN